MTLVRDDVPVQSRRMDGQSESIDGVTLSDEEGVGDNARAEPICAAHERELAVVAAVQNQVLCIAALVGLAFWAGVRPSSGWRQPRR